MFCPGCGFQANDDLKFCRQCGSNLHNVRDAMTSQSAGNKFDWSRAWWAGHIYSAEELERMRGDTPEEQRVNEERRRLKEIKGGVITGLIGVGVMITFYFFFGAVADVSNPKAAEIVSRLWMLGIIPTLIGAGFLINGFFISPRMVALKEQLARAAPPAPPPLIAQAGRIEAKTTDQLIADAQHVAHHSVTEDSTSHLA